MSRMDSFGTGGETTVEDKRRGRKSQGRGTGRNLSGTTGKTDLPRGGSSNGWTEEDPS